MSDETPKMSEKQRAEWLRVRQNAQAMLDAKLAPAVDESETKPAERPINTPRFEQMEE